VRQRGLIVVFTGDGKGKTSAALGIALRSCGHGMRVAMVQFVKSPTETGEEKAAERLKPELELVTMGKGFVDHPAATVSRFEHQKAAEAALELARQRITSGYWDVVILDEINIAVRFGLISVDDVIVLLRNKPAKLHVVLTGRDAHPGLLELADVVTEMRNLKHPFDDHRLPAQQGIDY
jgi:cob(I)alamin adenosyltransferase